MSTSFLTQRRARQNREMEDRIQSGTAALESRPSLTPEEFRIKESYELGHRAHRLASRPGAGRRDATRSGLGSKTSQFFDRLQVVKGGRKNWDKK
jgi:hypothetical protein